MLRILRVLAPNPDIRTLEGTNTWVLAERPAVVIDPGPDDPDHLREVERAAGSIGAILLTHDHPDHAPGAPALARAADAPLLAFRPPEGGERLRDGQVVTVDGVAVTAVATPGHSPDHFAFFVASEGALFTGDAVLGRGTSVIDPPDGDLALYLRSLRRMRELGPRTIYPGHGPVVLDAMGKLDEYLDHRAMREEQVLVALQHGPRTPEEIVPDIYGDYSPEVHALAGRSVLAHLIKLEGEGRVARSAKDGSYSLLETRTCERCGRPVKGRGRFCGRCSLAVLQEQPER